MTFPKAVRAACLALALPGAYAQSLATMPHQPADAALMPFLLTDGRVLAQGAGLTDWFALTPDESGSYLNGTWKAVAPIPPEWNYAPDAFASAVLADGRLVVCGGEYNQGAFALTPLGAVYDPVTDTWTQLAPPPGWLNIGDSPSVVLADGRFVVGRKLDEQMAALDPKTLTWTLLGSSGKSDFNSEEGWTLMPDGTVLTVDVLDSPNSERYLPAQGAWVSDGSTIVDLHQPTGVVGCLPYDNGCYFPPGETGPQILMPDGTVFAMGGANVRAGAHTSVYHPGTTPSAPGTWVPGPDFPRDDMSDAAASLLPNGHVLAAAASGRLYEYDGRTLTRTATGAAGAILLTLPSGETLVTGSHVKIYTTAGAPDPAWAPRITSVKKTLARGGSYQVKGTQFNGLSQAAALGDEFETSTNYPLVRITNKASGHVRYARTHDHSSMGVATGAAVVSTHFDLPATLETGASTLEVVANGIASPKVKVTIQ